MKARAEVLVIFSRITASLGGELLETRMISRDLGRCDFRLLTFREFDARARVADGQHKDSDE